MPRIAIISDRGRRFNGSGGKEKSLRKEQEKEQVMGNAGSSLRATWRERSESKRGGGRERRRESERRMSPVAVGAEEKRVTRCWVGLWDLQESRGAEMR